MVTPSEAQLRYRKKIKNSPESEKKEYREKHYPEGKKQCPCCGEYKDFSLYGKKSSEASGLRSQCKLCESKKIKEYRLLNRDKIKSNRKKRYDSKKDFKVGLIVDIRTAYINKNMKRCPHCGFLLHVNLFPLDDRTKDGFYYLCKDCQAANSKNWVKNNKEKRKEICDRHYAKKRKNYKKRRYSVDLKFKTEDLLRGRFNSWLKNKGTCNDGSFQSLIGYEKWKALDWLNSLGYISGYHHIDHIVPLSAFNPLDKIHVKFAWHYLNLQPLTANENLKKGNKLPANWESIILGISKAINIDGTDIIRHIKYNA